MYKYLSASIYKNILKSVLYFIAQWGIMNFNEKYVGGNRMSHYVVFGVTMYCHEVYKKSMGHHRILRRLRQAIFELLQCH